MKFALFPLLLAGITSAAPVASWSFERIEASDQWQGFHRFSPGISGQSLRSDGQTTHLIRPAAQAPRLNGAFTIEAWVAIQTYPWTWCAIVNQEQNLRRGFSFSIDPNGHFGLHVAVAGKWIESRSEKPLPLYRWNHIAAAFDPASGIRLYWNGAPAGALAVTGPLEAAAATDLWIARNLTPRPLSEEVRVVADVAYSFDGLIDEVAIHDQALSQFSSPQPPAQNPLGPPVLPAGPKGPGRFGAYYTRLRYTEEWERLWRVGEQPDVVVRFDDNPTRLVFWRGTSYVPAWVTENGIWYTNEFYENQREGMPTSAEPMADKQARYSTVKILESTPARVVVQWRYAPVSVHYEPVFVDPLTGWGDWVEETYTVYPDGSCSRKIQTFSSSPYVVPGQGRGEINFRQFHESIVINPPGTRPEDNIKAGAITLGNMNGETHTYNWEKEPPGEPATFDPETLKVMHRISDVDTHLHKWLTKPAHGNIHLVNLKARYSPFVVVDPRHVAIDCYAGEIIRERSMFPWWNHWPVSQQIRSNGRWAVAPDRVSHSSLTHIQSWMPHQERPDGITMVMLNGLTTGGVTELLPLAKSWLNPPPVSAHSTGFESKGFDRLERAFVLVRREASATALDVTLQANPGSPLVNPALLIRNWNASQARVRVNGRLLSEGSALRTGLTHHIDGAGLVVFLRHSSETPLRITVSRD
ncbi:MAG: LamG domain-containing protein [Acidobacteria bacterium]|nr:LamG domain-containing protein [Acidobacteriota bacterium]